MKPRTIFEVKPKKVGHLISLMIEAFEHVKRNFPELASKEIFSSYTLKDNSKESFNSFKSTIAERMFKPVENFLLSDSYASKDFERGINPKLEKARIIISENEMLMPTFEVEVEMSDAKEKSEIRTKAVEELGGSLD